MNDHVTITDASAKPGAATDNVNIQDSASHAYSAAGQTDFLKASAAGKDTSAGSLPNLSISDNSSSNSQSSGGSDEKATDDPYTRQAIARIFNQTAPSSYGGDSCLGGADLVDEEEPQHEAAQGKLAADGSTDRSGQPATAGQKIGSNSVVKSMMQAERVGAVAQQSQNRSVAP